jgi:hypothetical protein
MHCSFDAMHLCSPCCAGGRAVVATHLPSAHNLQSPLSARVQPTLPVTSCVGMHCVQSTPSPTQPDCFLSYACLSHRRLSLFSFFLLSFLLPSSLHRRGDQSTWPLVRVCRIQHNWPVLATGAMLVDLPGVRDVNAARGRVAEAYLKVRPACLLACVFRLACVYNIFTGLVVSPQQHVGAQAVCPQQHTEPQALLGAKLQEQVAAEVQRGLPARRLGWPGLPASKQPSSVGCHHTAWITHGASPPPPLSKAALPPAHFTSPAEVFSHLGGCRHH